MFRSALRTALSISALALALPVLAQSQSPQPEPPLATDQAKMPAHPVPKPGDRDCLRQTGSLIPAKPGTCLPVPGRSYSQQDIRSTGALTTGDALRQLDPSITVRGH